MKILKIADDLMPSVLDGSKSATIRYGRRNLRSSELLTFESVNSGDRAVVIITRVAYKKLSELEDWEAKRDGAGTAIEMSAALKRFYPDIGPDSDITVIEHTEPTVCK